MSTEQWRPIGASKSMGSWSILLARYDDEAGEWEFKTRGIGALAVDSVRLDADTGEWVDGGE